jgi:predicted DNA-binding transcriptional regulator YafY
LSWSAAWDIDGLSGGTAMVLEPGPRTDGGRQAPGLPALPQKLRENLDREWSGGSRDAFAPIRPKRIVPCGLPAKASLVAGHVPRHPVGRCAGGAAMDRYERILTLHRMLKAARFPVPRARIEDELGCSRATAYRDVAFLRDALGAPIESDGEHGAIRYADGEAERFELPGLWLNSEELAALLALNELLDRSEPGVLAGALAPFRQRMEQLLSGHANGKALPLGRIRVIASGARKLDQASFRTVAGAVLERKRLGFGYRARSTDAETERTVSPQRLTHYRDNWYLDAWDHSREALRSFALDRIRKPQALEQTALDKAGDELDQHLASSYGIFSGPPKAWATVRFSAHAARWAADERWHSQQQGQWLADGSWELKLPYSNSRELLMDLMKYGPDAEVVAPVPLREEMKILLGLALGAYQHES